MAWTQTDLDKIETAIVRLVLRVRFSDGREVEYPSVKEMLAARDAIKSDLAGAASSTRCTYAQFVKD